MRYLLSLLCMLVLIPVAAIGEQDISPVDLARYPTVARLAEVEQPRADYVDLAQRFRGVEDIPARPTTAPDFVIGDRQMFFVSASNIGTTTQVEAELLAAGEHVLVWVEVDSGMQAALAQEFADRFTDDVYLPTRALWGSEDSPGIDGDSRIYVLFTREVARGIAAYFSGQNVLPAAVQPASNERDMMVFNLATLTGVTADSVLSTAAHEFQHMIMHHQDLNEESWLDEGFSMFTEYLLQLGDVNWSLRSFVQHPDNQLTLWGVEDNNAADYGASLLFMVYLYERFGLETLQAIYASPLNGLAAVEAVLEAQDAGSVERLFADWVVMNTMSPYSTSYRYSTLSEKPPAASATIYSLPYSRNQRLQQYATDYYQFGVLPASGQLQLSVKIPQDAVLIPLNTLDGVQFWYSGRGDDSNPRLTRAFDLRGVTSAELSYRIWYALETGWDYGYLSISADGGRTWQIQETPRTTTDDPYQKAYGAAYNGRSAGWEQERISLDAFAGQEILVRFEVVTDDATHEAGMAIDDVRVDALDYVADFESDDGGWFAEGWVLTDNRLPQRAWLQLAQQVGDEVVLSRWLIEGNAEHTVSINPAAQRTILMISPFAPVTGESTTYSIEVLEN